MNTRPIGMLCALLVGATSLQVQTPPPQPEIFLAPFETEGKTTRIAFLSISRPGNRVGTPVVNITNNPGYDNQPHFLPDSSALLFSSNRDGAQTDIYRYDLASKATTQLTRTTDNEYSPTVAPDGKTFTTVRGTEQRLWRFNLDGSDAGLAYAHAGLIGYHAWVSPTTVATFILATPPAPNTLQLVDVSTGASETIASNIGRSLLSRPGRRTVSFVQKLADGSGVIKELDATARTLLEIAPTVAGSEDLAWTPGGIAMMGSKSKLFAWEASTDRWVETADLEKAGVQNITRLAISPDGRWIAIVAEPVVK